MSYDLLVFEPSVAPRDHADFKAWWDEQSKWSEDHGYNDVHVCTPGLQSWYNEITKSFPNLNGPGVDYDDINDNHTDYSLGRSVIYAAFAWSQAENAYPLVRELAAKHGIGFYDVSGNGEIYLPADIRHIPSQGAMQERPADFRTNGAPESKPDKLGWLMSLFRRK
jgi:hypothetical protein